MRLIEVVALASLVMGCATARPVAEYSIPLTEVRRPADVANRWGEYRIEPADSGGYTYTDELLRAIVVPVRGYFIISIENRTEHSLRVIWDEMAYVGPNGFASKVTSGDTRRIDFGRSQMPTVIPASSRVSLMAIPNDHLSEGAYGRIEIADFVSVCARPQDVDGKEVKLVVPIQVAETINEYTFLFRITNVSVPNLSPDKRRLYCPRVS